jgi:hypothetical protein
MRLESLIELWLASDNRSACRFQNGLAWSQPCDETTEEESTKVARSDQPMAMERKAGTSLLNGPGLDIKKKSGRRRSVFLDILSYRTKTGFYTH